MRLRGNGAALSMIAANFCPRHESGLYLLFCRASLWQLLDAFRTHTLMFALCASPCWRPRWRRALSVLRPPGFSLNACSTSASEPNSRSGMCLIVSTTSSGARFCRACSASWRVVMGKVAPLSPWDRPAADVRAIVASFWLWMKRTARLSFHAARLSQLQRPPARTVPRRASRKCRAIS